LRRIPVRALCAAVRRRICCVLRWRSGFPCLFRFRGYIRSQARLVAGQSRWVGRCLRP